MVLDIQPVTSASLPKQDLIPPGDWDMQLSWSVPNQWMSLRIPELEGLWAFKECAGRAVVQGCDNESGRILLRATAAIDGDLIRFWRPDDAVPHKPIPEVSLDVIGSPHYRLCRDVLAKRWRLLDENPKSPKHGELILGTGFVGDIVLNWLDHGSHIFQDGPAGPDADGLFHLYDPLIDY